MTDNGDYSSWALSRQSGERRLTCFHLGIAIHEGTSDGRKKWQKKWSAQRIFHLFTHIHVFTQNVFRPFVTQKLRPTLPRTKINLPINQYEVLLLQVRKKFYRSAISMGGALKRRFVLKSTYQQFQKILFQDCK